MTWFYSSLRKLSLSSGRDCIFIPTRKPVSMHPISNVPGRHRISTILRQNPQDLRLMFWWPLLNETSEDSRIVRENPVLLEVMLGLMLYENWSIDAWRGRSYGNCCSKCFLECLRRIKARSNTGSLGRLYAQAEESHVISTKTANGIQPMSVPSVVAWSIMKESAILMLL